MNKIVLVGAGQFGSRHLQGLALVNKAIEIYVVDINNESLRIAENRFWEVASNQNFKGEIKFVNLINDLPNDFDIAIVACDSLHRKEVIIQLLVHGTFRYLILEKFLFPSINDYSEVETLLEKKAIKTWVNCTRRMFDTYIRLNKIIQDQNEISINVTGSNLNLGSNAVHFVDLFCFLSGETTLSLSSSELIPKIADSKRPGFIDFFGTLNFICGSGKHLSITSFEQGNAPVLVEINTPKYRFIIQETGKSFVTYANVESEWVWRTEEFLMKFQSNLTNILVEEILNTGNCGLTSYADSAGQHLVLLNEFTNHYSKFTNKNQKICPIT